MAVPTLIYGGETWTLQKDIPKIEDSEIKFLRAAEICSLRDHRRNEDIYWYDLKVSSVIYRIQEYRQLWKARVEWTVDIYIPKQVLKYRPDVGGIVGHSGL